MDLLRSLGPVTSPVLIALAAVSVLALAVILERAWAWGLAKARRAQPRALLELARQGPGPAARHEAARLARRDPYARVLAQWLDSQGHRGHVEQAVTREEALLDRNVWVLDCAATIGPLLGILGTLVGISRSFSGFDAITQLDPTVVSRGISLALNSTVVGLGITVVSVVAAHFFRRMTDGAVSRLENFGEALLSVKER
ncbi:MAG: MotA/TolQ/ExbB proton channel family protein [Candidatus Brocadiia bacterium]